MRNPAKLLKLKGEWEAFTRRHPKLIRYLSVVSREYTAPGTRLDVTVTDPEGKSLHANAMLSEEDLAFLQEVRDLLGGR